MSSREDELKWAAGFFDGEGYIGLKVEHRPSPQPRVQLCACASNTDIRPLEDFVRLFGGTRVRSSPPIPGRKVVYRWDTIGVKSYEFLKEIRPYLRVKGEQADLAITFWELPWRTKRGQRAGSKRHVSSQRTAEQTAVDLELARKVRALKHMEVA